MQIYSIQSYNTIFQAKGGKVVKQVADNSKAKTDIFGVPKCLIDEFAQMGISHSALLDYVVGEKNLSKITASKLLKKMKNDLEWCEELKCRIPSSKEVYEKSVLSDLKYGGFNNILSNNFEKLLENPKIFADLIYKGIIRLPRIPEDEVLKTLTGKSDGLIAQAKKMENIKP